MGMITDDILTFIGILPLPPKPDFNRYKKFEKTKEERLNELNGKKIVVKDYHAGVIAGKLEYAPCTANFDVYNIHTENNNYRLHLHDLVRIF